MPDLPTPPSPPSPPSKKDVTLALLERAEARVHLDARHPGVVVPDWLAHDGHLRLDFSYGFTPPIPDLTVDDAGIRATLSFRGRPFSVTIPWPAVYLVADYDGNGAVWQEDIPADLIETIKESDTPPEPPPEPPKKPRPSHLKLVK
ncbi:MAG TPA: ClpXP protease specificity-enhancing factor SspB [Polyangia bacterium]